MPSAYDDVPFGVDVERQEAAAARSAQVRERADAILMDRDARRLADDMVADAVPPLRILRRGDLARLPRPVPVWDGWLYAGAPALVASPGGVGKSALLLGLAVASWHGLPLLGAATRQGRTLYLTREGQGAIDLRLSAWEQHLGVPIGSTEIDAVVDRTLDRATLRQLGDAVADGQHSLVVADTFSSVTSVRSENDNAEISDLLRAWHEATLQANPSAVPVLSHHVTETVDAKGRRSQKSRGASAFRDDHATVLLLEGTADALSMSTEIGRAGKQKDAPPRTLAGLALRKVGPAMVVVETTDTEREAHVDRIRRLVELLVPGNGYSSAELKDRWGLKSQDTYQTLRTEALDLGLLTKGEGHQGRYSRVAE